MNVLKQHKFLLSIAVLLNSAMLIAQKDSLCRRGVFISFNGLANGVSDHVTGKNFYHAIITPQCGYWLTPQFVSGASASFGFTGGNTQQAVQEYLQQEYNVFLNYFPFRKKGWRWIGWNLQGGFSNSCMLPLAAKRHFYLSAASGPVINAGKKFAFTYTFPFYMFSDHSCPSNFNWFNLSTHVRPHLGISYTFKL